MVHEDMQKLKSNKKSLGMTGIKLLVVVWVITSVSAALAGDGGWVGPSFRDFSGACQANPVQPPNAILWDKALGWNRDGLSWQKWQPEPGKWDESYFSQFCQDIRAFRQRGADTLVMLGYNTSWSSEPLSLDVPYEVNYGDQWRREIEVLSDGNYEARTYTRGGPDRDWALDRVFVIKDYRKNKIPLASEHVEDWENYVRKAVSALRKSPYNIEYFQIWNEAHPKSGFWDGDLDTYMQRVHLPAAKIVRELGGKVVYGGWIHGAPIEEFIELLDRHQAWQTLDILDVHYMPPRSFDALRKAADSRGHERIGIWQTEIANSPKPYFISNNYPRFLYWSLAHDWDYRDKYKLFFFSYKSPKLSEHETAVNRTLYGGEDLSPHGLSLLTLGTLLQGDGMRTYDAVQSRPALRAELDTGASSLESFAVGNRVILAVHLAADVRKQLANDSGMKLALAFPKIVRSSLLKLERVDIANGRSDLTSQVQDAAGGIRVDLPVEDDPSGAAARWNGQALECKTFYVALTLAERLEGR